MTGPRFNKFSRRAFLAACLGGTAYLLLRKKATEQKIAGEIISSGSEFGHMLRDNKFPSPVKTEKADVVIIGSGISGLSAARWLNKSGLTDITILELDKEAGGNAASGKNDFTSFPWAAHYIPIINGELKELGEFLVESGVITSYDAKGLPVYEESYLCFEPEERLFIHGTWQRGTIPELGISAVDKEEFTAFFKMIEWYKSAKGNDGKPAFTFPIDDSSSDAIFRELDSISFSDLIAQKGWNSSYLMWYLNYSCRDDFGTNINDISAWAGIHYFAARRGTAANAEPGSYLTWPQGNAFLADKLMKDLKGSVRYSSPVFKIRQEEEKLYVDLYDGKLRQSLTIECNSIICAAPQFVRQRLLPDYCMNNFTGVSYAPWMVANITASEWTEGTGQTLCWDNVIYGSDSLGYVDATHQSLRLLNKRKVMTYYYPFTGLDTKAEREKLRSMSHEQICTLIMNDLSSSHQGLKEFIERIDVRFWGHAMVKPVKGYIWGIDRSELKKPIDNRIFFCHTDLGGISVFEEAFYQGVRAAKELIEARKTT